ncbi:MAG: DUF3224 domain-containing protein [Gemmatimonadaceae bacterium]
MPTRAHGTFTVKMNKLPTDESSPLARMSIDKEFQGDLAGTSKGEMLTIGTATKGSAVYVAIEHVTGTLGGKSGSFSLHHTGIMNRGAPSLTISVVPDSGTDELAGLTGTLNIMIEGGQHSYEFDYELPAE